MSAAKTMELNLTRCTIRDWRMDDAPSLAKHANNRRVSINLRDRFPYPYGIEDAKNFIERAMSNQPEKNFCIEIDGAAVGGIGIQIGEDVFRHTAELGYWLGQEFWGRGVMTKPSPCLRHIASRNFRFIAFSLKRFPTIRLPRAFWKRPVSF